MSRKLCPVSGRIIDIVTHRTNSVQIVSHYGKWQSSLFDDQFEMMDWFAKFDLKSAAPKAAVVKAQHGFRLRGDGWMTMTMSLMELDEWCKSLGIKNPVKEQAAAAAKKKVAPKKATVKAEPEQEANDVPAEKPVNLPA